MRGSVVIGMWRKRFEDEVGIGARRRMARGAECHSKSNMCMRMCKCCIERGVEERGAEGREGGRREGGAEGKSCLPIIARC